jgi:hypothetical protein
VNQDTPSRRPPVVPDDWDHLGEPFENQEPPPGLDPPPPADEESDSVIPSIASAWGDLASMLGLCAAALIALKVAGHGAPFAAAPWAAAVALLWWLVAATVLVMVRRGTPGMLMAGLMYEDAVPPARIPWVALTALLLAASLGIPSAIGRPGWALRAAAGTPVTVAGREIQ